MAVNDYDALIQDAAREWRVDPVLIKAVMHQESGGNRFKNGKPITSSAGAGGLMQIMPKTAAGLGLTDVHDPEQAIFGGAKYLRQMLDQFKGDTTLAVAAYNTGPGNVRKYLASGRLHPETAGYVPAVASHYRMFAGQEGGALPRGVQMADASGRVPIPAASGGESVEDFLKSTGAAVPAPGAKAAPANAPAQAAAPQGESVEDFLKSTGAKVAEPAKAAPANRPAGEDYATGNPMGDGNPPVEAAPPPPVVAAPAPEPPRGYKPEPPVRPSDAYQYVQPGPAQAPPERQDYSLGNPMGDGAPVPAYAPPAPAAPRNRLMADQPPDPGLVGGAMDPREAAPNMGGMVAGQTINPGVRSIIDAARAGYDGGNILNPDAQAYLDKYHRGPGALMHGVNALSGAMMGAGKGAQETINQLVGAVNPQAGRDAAGMVEAFLPGHFHGMPVNVGAARAMNRLAPVLEPAADGIPTMRVTPENPLAPAVNAPAFVPPGAKVPVLDRIRELIEADNQVAANRPDMIPPNATQPPNPLSAGQPAPRTVPPVNRLAPAEPSAPIPDYATPKAAPKVETPADTAIPNGLTPEQVAEFKNIPEEVPPVRKPILTQADAERRADELVRHFASIGPKDPIPGAHGSLPTITGNAGLATLYRAIRDKDPVPFTALEGEGKAKSSTALADLIKKPEDLKAMEETVNATTGPMREKALKDATDVDRAPVLAKIDEILESPSKQNDTVVRALTAIRKKVETEKSADQFYGIDKAIRASISPLAAGTTADARLATHELKAVQSAVRSGIVKAAPGFEEYMAKHSEMMRPVDEQRYLQSKILTDTQDQPTLMKLHGMLNEIKKHQAMPGIKLADSLSPATMARLNEIHAQMQREATVQTAGKSLGSNTHQNFATMGKLNAGITGHTTNALLASGAGGLMEAYMMNGTGQMGAMAGAALSGARTGYKVNRALKASEQEANAHRMVVKELRDRLLNIDNKGVNALRGRE